jgi:hypothetical protein
LAHFANWGFTTKNQSDVNQIGHIGLGAQEIGAMLKSEAWSASESRNRQIVILYDFA